MSLSGPPQGYAPQQQRYASPPQGHAPGRPHLGDPRDPRNAPGRDPRAFSPDQQRPPPNDFMAGPQYGAGSPVERVMSESQRSKAGSEKSEKRRSGFFGFGKKEKEKDKEREREQREREQRERQRIPEEGEVSRGCDCDLRASAGPGERAPRGVGVGCQACAAWDGLCARQGSGSAATFRRDAVPVRAVSWRCQHINVEASSTLYVHGSSSHTRPFGTSQFNTNP
jgi:hypothetical protein